MSLFDLNEYAGAGMDEVPSGASVSVLKIVQKGSPEFDESHKKHAEKRVEGCRPGDVVMAGRVIKRPFRVVPLASTAIYAEFKPASAGGGFVSNQPLSIVEDRRYRKGTPGTPTEFKEYLGENELQYNIVYAVKFSEGQLWEDATIMFSSTELKAARAWGRLIKGSKHPKVAGIPPIFANSYMFKTAPQQNSKGSWMGWDISRPTDSAVTEDVDLQMFADAYKGARVMLPSSGPAVPQAAIPAPAPDQGPEDGDVPF